MLLKERNPFFYRKKVPVILLFSALIPLLHACELSDVEPSQTSVKVPMQADLKVADLPPDHPQKAKSVDKLLDGLVHRLEQQPDDTEGWVLLAKSYHYLGEPEKAKSALDRARDLGYEGAGYGSDISGLRAQARNVQVQNERSSTFFREPIYEVMEEIITDPAKSD